MAAALLYHNYGLYSFPGAKIFPVLNDEKTLPVTFVPVRGVCYGKREQVAMEE